jgi:hypothetical protein
MLNVNSQIYTWMDDYFISLKAGKILQLDKSAESNNNF